MEKTVKKSFEASYIKFVLVFLSFAAVTLAFVDANQKLHQRLAEQDAIMVQMIENGERLEQAVRLAIEDRKTLEQRLSEVSLQKDILTAELQSTKSKLNNAIVPESSWKEVGQRHIVEPAVNAYNSVADYVRALSK